MEEKLGRGGSLPWKMSCTSPPVGSREATPVVSYWRLCKQRRIGDEEDSSVPPPLVPMLHDSMPVELTPRFDATTRVPTTSDPSWQT